MKKTLKKLVALATAVTMMFPVCAINAKAVGTTKGWTLVYNINALGANPWKNANDKETGNGDAVNGVHRKSSDAAPWTATLTTADTFKPSTEPCLGMYVDVNAEPNTQYKIEYELEGTYTASESAKTPKGAYLNFSDLDSRGSRIGAAINDNNQIHSLDGSIKVDENTQFSDDRKRMIFTTQEGTAAVRLQFNLRRVGVSETVTISNVKVYKWDDSILTYDVTVDGQAYNDLAYNTKIMLTASEEDENGEKFSYWQKNGHIVSYSNEYSFYVYEDAEIIPIYAGVMEPKNCYYTLYGKDENGHFIYFAEATYKDGTENNVFIFDGVIKPTGKENILANKKAVDIRTLTAGTAQFKVDLGDVSGFDATRYDECRVKLNYGKDFVYYFAINGSSENDGSHAKWIGDPTKVDGMQCDSGTF